MASTSSTPSTATARTPRKAAVAAWSGSALEYYDLAIYGTAAALVFPKIFFPEGNGHAATIASLATFGVAYVARPFGSFLMGHIGDRLGRKTVLIGTLLLMGVSTFLIGVLPTYSQVGLLAPALLVTLRLLQGLSAAGEQAGANSMSFEHAPDRRRGFFTSFTLSGTQAGQVLAPAVFLPVAALMPEEQLLSWGWRVPFWLSAVLLVVGFLIRRSLEETPEFTAQTAAQSAAQASEKASEKAARPARTPLTELFRDHRGAVLRVFFAAFIAMVNTTFQVFALNFATSEDYGIGIERNTMLWLAIVSNLVAIATIPVWATLSDRIGRKPVFVGGAVGSAVLVTAFLAAIAAGNVVLLFVLGVALAGVVYSMPNAVWPATYAEYFPTSVRLSGMAVGTQFGFALAGFTPTIAGALVGGSADGWWKVALFAVAACAISSIAVLTGPRDTHLVPTAQVGQRRVTTHGTGTGTGTGDHSTTASAAASSTTATKSTVSVV
ncbi:Na+/melibiose symporter [Quadrisphaera granulorum]|uniref:Na+/melibiose symporter-like transporter n=1 Tax=Quadrisphaera granulorum TaxID=317664 RepID=A0A316AEQ8_9ACTN|nr:MFS transporter [Quadrisphaera granulorum]PWJ56101.1 Na+/melibiose symporter-like transporter [Quadrisphaera granulorum]SZE94735.1 Na+/melibiose symporter [Quadrisphaera granulorum]